MRAWDAAATRHASGSAHPSPRPALPASLPPFSPSAQLFGSMLPEQLLNQGGDLLLFELYQSFGATAVCGSVTVENAVGAAPHGSAFAWPPGSLIQPLNLHTV